MKLKSYLKIGIIGSIVLTIVLGVSMAFMVMTMNSYQTLLKEQNELTNIVGKMEDTSSYLANEAKLYSLSGDPIHLQNYENMVATDSFNVAMAEFTQLGVPEEIVQSVSAVRDASASAAEFEMDSFNLVAVGELEQAQQLLAQPGYVQGIAAVGERYKEFITRLIDWSNAEIAKEERLTMIAMITAAIAAMLFIAAVLIILVMINKKVQPLYTLAANAEKIAAGDLTVDKVEVKDQDEIGHLSMSFNAMVDSLRGVLKTVSQSSMEVAASSEELLANAEQTSSTSKQVATSIHDIASQSEQQQQQMAENTSALNEVTIGIQQVASAAEDVSEASTDAKARAEAGKSSITHTIKQMQTIKGSVDYTSSAIQELTKHSQQIETFVTAITDISNQTNLLALNAAIEAARAGDAGKGFAVVADEVRKLAEQSNQSANHITEIIHALQQKVTETSQYMADVTKQVDEGVATVTETGTSFENIMQATTTVSDQMTGVSAIAEQMAASAQQMSAIFEQLQHTTNQTAENSQQSTTRVEEQYGAIQEITASSTMLAGLAETLNQEVSKFKL